MPTDNYLNRGSIAKDAIREREMLAARKKAAGGIVNSPRTGAAPAAHAPQAAPAQPYAPPLTVQEITQKFMGGPAVQPTGIPQQNAQNPATAAPQAPAPTQPLLRPDQQDRLSAQRARVSAGATQRDYKRAFDSGAGADELNRIGQNMDDYRRIDAGYQAQQSGAPGPAFTQERTDAGRARLQEQAARIAAERAGQPLPGDTDTWSYEAGQKALPKELQGQKFTHPQDQANYRDFSRFVGGAPSIDPATGQMTTPADREYKSVQQLREEEIMARRKAAQPIDFAPFNPEEAQKNQAAATARYQETLRAAEAARGRVGQREGDYRTTAEAPTTVGAQMTRAQIAEQEKLRERAKADTSLIPGEAAAKGANDRLSALIAEGKARGLPQEEAVQQAKNALAIAEANAKAGAAPRMIEATTKAAEGEAGVKAATAGIQQKQLENYGKDGGAMQTRQQATDATENAAAQAAIRDASIKSTAPNWLAAQDAANPQVIQQAANALSTTAMSNSAGRLREAKALVSRLSELERLWPTLDEVQRDHLRRSVMNSFGETTDVADRPIGEQVAEGVSWALPAMWIAKGEHRLLGGASRSETLSEYQRIQQYINRLRSGVFGAGVPR